MAEQVTKSVLFVCLGNICRSPIAEAAFRKLVTDQNISDNRRTDSAAACTCELGSPPDYRGRFAWRSVVSPRVTLPGRLPKKTLPLLIIYYVWMRAIWEIWIEKVIKLKTAERKSNYSGTRIHKNNLSLKIPIMATTLTLRPSTSSACAAAGPSWRRFADPAVPLWPRLVPRGRVSSVKSVTVPVPRPQPSCRWNSVLVFGERVNKKIFDSDSLWGKSSLDELNLPLCPSYKNSGTVEVVEQHSRPQRSEARHPSGACTAPPSVDWPCPHRLDGAWRPAVVSCHWLAVRKRTLSGQEGARLVGFILSTLTPS